MCGSLQQNKYTKSANQQILVNPKYLERESGGDWINHLYNTEEEFIDRFR